MIKVIHISETPLAGSPIRIVNALNKYTNIKARLIVYNSNPYKGRTYEDDICWHEEKNEALAIIEEADIIHLHHFLNLTNNLFGINFIDFQKKGKKIIRQFHTEPNKIASNYKINVLSIINDSLPQLVISQFHERYYPKAKIVPNIVPLNDSLYLPRDNSNEDISICYTPTNMTSAWSDRWNTKGYPETMQLLESIKNNFSNNLRINIGIGLNHSECLSLRQNSSIIIDELITGSFHIGSLEGLSQGKPTFCYLDNRMENVIKNFTGAKELPWVNYPLENVKKPLENFIKDKALRKEQGLYSRKWMEKYWNDKKLILYYEKVYIDILEGKWNIKLNKHNKQIVRNENEKWVKRLNKYSSIALITGEDLFKCGRLCKDNNLLEKACLFLKQALKWAQSVDRRDIICSSTFHLGEIYFLEQKYNEADKYLKKCLLINKNHKKANKYKDIVEKKLIL